MAVTVETLKALVEDELTTVLDTRVVAHIRRMLVEPYVLLRSWDYGEPGQEYPCWIVLKDDPSGSAIAYCEYGFGPHCPWGRVWSGAEERHRSMGMDCSWYTRFLNAFFEAMACVGLPIWRVYVVELDGKRTAVTDESEWEVTWSRIDDLRRSDPTRRYDVGHSIAYGC
jgi:hypothetical protein